MYNLNEVEVEIIDGFMVVTPTIKLEKIYRNEKGLLHREDGPAIERDDGTKEYWINGKNLKELIDTV